MTGTASFGYWVRRRRLALDLTQAALARGVGCSAAMIKKIEHDQRRPSRTMATRLAETLGIAPDLRSTFIAAGLGELTPERLGPTAGAGGAPPWMSAPSAPATVVGRDAELARLERRFEAAKGGHGGVVFVSGEAGYGKTALLKGLASRLLRSDPDVVIAQGAATAAGGSSDPYLAVRDVFRMLVADPHLPWPSDQFTREQASRLWSLAPEAARTLSEVGPHLLDVLVPAATIAERLGTVPSTGALGSTSRDHVVTEVTDVLQALSKRRPLVVLLDDMQWADTASAELVFHLARRAVGMRILIVCAYRTSEVADDPGAAASAISRALAETRRGADDPQVDLHRLSSEAARTLCDALLDLELPRLDAAARDAIYRRTHGHPLFVQELVRELKARGDLVRNADQSWSARPGMDWNQLPARVAAIIDQRLDRLAPDERTVLDAAAVEGEYFHAELAAIAAGVDERAVYRVLSRQLERTRGLVRETGPRDLGGRTFTRYRFDHVLFQQVAYEQLGEGQRRDSHGRIAAALESIHRDDTRGAAVQLAHHWIEAGRADRAVPYLIQAGDRARVLHAHAEAAAAYEHAAELLRHTPDIELLARTLMKAGLTYQTGFDHERAQRVFDEAFGLWSTVNRSSAAGRAASLRMLWREPETLDPTTGGYVLAAPMVSNLFSGLVRYDEDTNVVPDVAHRWEISDDGCRYTFHLREDARWSDGRPVTAHDFVYTYRRAVDPTTEGALVAPALLDMVAGARSVHAGSSPPDQLGVHAPDDHTLVIELSEPTSYFIYNLAYYVLLPVAQPAAEAHGKDWWRTVDTFISNGPFRLAEWEHGRKMVLERNPDYHGAARGNVSRVTLQLDVPEDEHEALYHNDDVDLLSTEQGMTSESVIHRLRQAFPPEYACRDAFVTMLYAIRSGSALLEDRRIRRAMVMAIDRSTYARSVGHGLSAPATGGLVPPGMPGHVPGVALSYDPAEAARLVAEVSAGAQLPEITLIARRGRERLVRPLVDAWRSIGLATAMVLSHDVAELERTISGPMVEMGGWIADYPDPDSFLRVLVGDRVSSMQGDAYQALLEKAARTTEPAIRLSAYRDAEKVMAEEAVVVPLIYESSHLMLKPWIASYPSVPVKYPGFWKDIVIGPH